MYQGLAKRIQNRKDPVTFPHTKKKVKKSKGIPRKLTTWQRGMMRRISKSFGIEREQLVAAYHKGEEAWGKEE